MTVLQDIATLERRDVDYEAPGKIERLHRLTPVTAEELLQREFPLREMVLSPWLPTQGLAMIFAPRGIGKTHVSLGLAYSIASATSFLRWSAPRPRRVLFIDGEMPGETLQSRLRLIIAGTEQEPPDPTYLRFIASDLEPSGLPDLASIEGQRFYDEALADAEVIIVDNISTICRGVRENEADSWGATQAWALAQRRQGKAVLFIHHAGKGGSQRGTSKKEDVLDSVINLRRPPDYTADQGARFEVHMEKARGVFGPDAEPFEARLSDGKWIMGDILNGDDDSSLRSMKSAGMSVRDIAERTGRSKSAVARRLKED